MIGVVLDTNIHVSANLNAEGRESFIVSLALNKRVQLYISPAILEEYERVLRYPRLKFVPHEIDRFLARLQYSSSVVHPTKTLSISRDEPDNRFLECAETAKAQFLITGNTKHFPLRHKATSVVTPREFIEHIGPLLTEGGR